MANESIVFSLVKTNPVVGQGDVTVALDGGELTDSNVLEVAVLKSAFHAAAGEGANTKAHLLNALKAIEAQIVKGAWPLEALAE